MRFFGRLLREKDGQGLVEYTFVVMLVALSFWLGVKDTSIGNSLRSGWSKVEICVNAPFNACAP
jgi:Flp pilus assembly pilin Flp